jgi:predicted dehydrogenase
MPPVRIGVLGAGEWGRNHLRVLEALPEATLVGFVDPDPARRGAAEAAHRVPGFADLAALAARGLDAVTIAVPTPAHRATALEAAARGLHMLVEKPLAATEAEADAILAETARRGVLLQVGHLERWNPAFRALRDRCRRPRFIEGHRLAPFGARGTEVAVVLDLMVHDLDLVLALVRQPVERVDAIGVAVLTREVDIANARIEFAGGAIANLTASRVSREKMRKVRVFEADAYVAANLVTREVECFRKVETPGARVPRIVEEEVSVEEEEPLRAELRAFARAVARGEPPEVGGAEGREAVALAARVLDAIAARGLDSGDGGGGGGVADRPGGAGTR